MAGKKWLRGLAIGAASVALALTTAVPASAAQGFSLWIPSRTENEGSGSAKGSITFTNKRTFKVGSTVHDWCPADGEGAYLVAAVRFMDGTIRTWVPINQDVNGCDNGGRSATVYRHYEKRVRNVTFILAQRDADGGGPWNNYDFSTKKDNPFTG